MRRWLLVAVAAACCAWTSGALDTASPQIGAIAYSDVDGTNIATSDTVITLSGRRRIVIITNSLNAAVMLVYNGADLMRVPAATGVAIDLSASGLTFADSKTIKVYHLGSAPTGSGFLSITAF